MQQNPIVWKKSSYSGMNGHCVEVADIPGMAGRLVGVRDSKDPQGAILAFASPQWYSFLAGVRKDA